jgi:hypothetical protein
MKKILGLLSSLWLGLAAIVAPVEAQQYPLAGGSAGQSVGSSVQMCVNASGQAAPCNAPGSGSSGYPPGSTPISAVFSGADTTTANAALAAGGAGIFTYVCGFSITGLGATAATPVSPTVATVANGKTLTYSYLFALGATAQNTPVSFTYAPCLPASAANAALTVTVPGAAGNTATQINAWGYQQ